VPSEPLRIPTTLRPQVEQILQITDAFCAQHLDGEYAALCRGLTGRLARKRPSPLARGDLRIWPPQWSPPWAMSTSCTTPPNRRT
jgi:Domain of unknown function (DUF6398)